MSTLTSITSNASSSINSISSTISKNTQSFLPSVILVVVLMLGTIVFFSLAGIDLLPNTKVVHSKVVTVESFDNKVPNLPKDNFCDEMKGKSDELEAHCNSFTKNSCLFSSCCVFASIDGKEQCMAGDKHGPTFKRNEDGTSKDVDYYYFKNICYGDKCKEM